MIIDHTFIEKGIKILETDLKNFRWVIEKSYKKYLVTRQGQCDFTKCNNICCKKLKIPNITNWEYFINFGSKGRINGLVIDKTCKHLNKNGKCNIWHKINNSCYLFPLFNDTLYWELNEHCTYYFKIKEIKN